MHTKLLRKIPQDKQSPSDSNRRSSLRPTADDRRALNARQSRAVNEAQTKLRRIAPECSLELRTTADDALRGQLCDVYRQAFSDYAPVPPQHFENRLRNKSAQLALVRHRGTLVGFALSFENPSVRTEALYIDLLGIAPSHQGKGVGTIIINLLARVAGIRGFRSLYLLTRLDQAGIPIIRFYQRSHFSVIGPYDDMGQLLTRPLSLTGPETAKEISTILMTLENRLRPALGSPQVQLYSSLDIGLAKRLCSLDSSFPESIRYDEHTFLERMKFPDAHVILVSDHGQPVAFSFSYQDPALPKHVMFADEVIVTPDFHRKGVGSALIEALLAVPALTQYTAVFFYCQDVNQDGVNLREYYRRFGAKVINSQNDRLEMLIPLFASESDMRFVTGRADAYSANQEPGFS